MEEGVRCVWVLNHAATPVFSTHLQHGTLYPASKMCRCTDGSRPNCLELACLHRCWGGGPRIASNATLHVFALWCPLFFYTHRAHHVMPVLRSHMPCSAVTAVSTGESEVQCTCRGRVFRIHRVPGCTTKKKQHHARAQAQQYCIACSSTQLTG